MIANNNAPHSDDDAPPGDDDAGTPARIRRRGFSPAMLRRYRAADPVYAIAGEHFDEAIDEADMLVTPAGSLGGKFNAATFAVDLTESLKIGGVCTVFYRGGNWYRWEQTDAGARWLLIDKTIVEDIVSTDLREREGDVTVPMIRNVMAALRPLLRLPDAEQSMPFWTDGTPAGQYVAVRNGVLNLDAAMRGDTDALRPHSPHWRSLSCLPFDYAPSATCGEMERVLLENLEGDRERYAIVQEWAGYLLTAPGWRNMQKFLLVQGPGGSGKSTMLNVFRAIVGAPNCSAVDLQSFGDKFQRFSMYGKLANIAGDMKEITNADEGILKQMTGGDLMSWEAKFMPTVAAQATAKLMFGCNDLPRWRDRSGALQRRQILLTLTRVVPAGARNLDYEKAAYWQDSGQMPGVLNWAIAGLRRLADQRTFTHSDRAALDLDAHMLECNPARAFLEEHCRPSAGGWVATEKLYGAYRRWALDRGYQPLADNQFGKAVTALFPDAKARQKQTGGTRSRVYPGVEYLDPSDTRRRASPRVSDDETYTGMSVSGGRMGL